MFVVLFHPKTGGG